jgi:IS30 family transposase
VAAATNENTNRLLRDYFPKSSDLKIYSPSDLARVSDELNRRPRKTLGWQTPHDLFVSLRQGVV